MLLGLQFLTVKVVDIFIAANVFVVLIGVAAVVVKFGGSAVAAFRECHNSFFSTPRLSNIPHNWFFSTKLD